MDKPRENGILVIAASIIAVIRLRGPEIKPSPKLVATIKDSVHLAGSSWLKWRGERETKPSISVILRCAPTHP